MKQVLWLPSWYPNRRFPFEGDFIERHARAVSAFVKVLVLYVTKDDTLPPGKIETEYTEEDNLVVYKVYYGKSGLFAAGEQLYSLWRFRQLQQRFYKQLIQQHGPPDLVHVQVAMKAGLLALHLQNKHNIPYVLTEHWTGYYRTSDINIYKADWLSRYLTKRIIRRAKVFMPVSEDLGRTVFAELVTTAYTPVPNVADTRYFHYTPAAIPVFRFIHPSTLNYQKNPKGMITACAALVKAGYAFELHLVGNDDAAIKQFAASLGLLNKYVFVHPVISYEQVAKEMQQSSALLLFSRFENQPCIILEALCCGLPVIATRVGGIPEVINDSNGLLVESEDVETLVHAMQDMIDNYARYDRKGIAEEGRDRYGYEVVGKQIVEVYKGIRNTGVLGNRL